MQIAPSSYYAARARPPSARSVADGRHLEVIRRVHAENYGVYGVRKMHAELNRRGHRIARCTVHRLMRTEGLRGISRAKGPRTTIPGRGPDTRPDLLDRDFVHLPRTGVWVADSTYCRTFASWVYAAFIVDVYSRRVVGWQLSRSLRIDLALDALEMGLWTRAHAGQDTTGVIAHSDRESSTSPCATPSGSPMPARSHRSGRPATPTIMRWPRRSTRCLRPSWSATEVLGRALTTSISLSLSISTGSTIDAFTASSDSSTGRVRRRALPAQPRIDYRRRVSSESPLNPARDTRTTP